MCFECKNKYYTYKWKCHLDVIMRFDKYICVVYSNKIVHTRMSFINLWRQFKNDLTADEGCSKSMRNSVTVLDYRLSTLFKLHSIMFVSKPFEPALVYIFHIFLLSARPVCSIHSLHSCITDRYRLIERS